MEYFDKALTGVLDGIERNVVEQVREAAAAALEEYPAQDAPCQAVQPAEWDKAPQAISFWRLYNLEERKAQLNDHLHRVASEKASKDKSAPSLIRRAEEAEAIVQELCQRLLQAPDPLPYLNEGLSAQQTIEELRKNNKRLQKDTEAAEKEATSVVSVVTQAQRAEAARAELVKQLEEESAKVAALQTELAGTDDLRLLCTKQEAELEQIRSSHSVLRAEHQRTQNELFEIRHARDVEASAMSNDAELATQDHEQALVQIRQLQHEVHRSQQRLEQALAERDKIAATSETSQREEQLTRAVQRLESEIQRLRQAEDTWKTGNSNAWQEKLQEAQADILQLQEELKARPALQEVQELRDRLQTAEALLDAQMAAEDSGASADLLAGTSSPAQSLISTLQARNRRLVADNNRLRQQVEAADRNVFTISNELQEAIAAREEQQDLVKCLEKDLLTSSGGNRKDEASLRTDSSVMSSQGMLQIVTSQRDRFRKRVEKMEAEAENSKKALQTATSRVKLLEADNLGLYERIRYLQRYQSQRAAGPATAYKIVNVDGAGVPQPAAGGLSHRLSCGPLQLHLGGATDQSVRSRGRGSRASCLGGDEPDEELGGPKSALEHRYSKAYESKINPFAEFQASEREGRLPTHERALLTGSKVLLSNRAGRVFAVAYLVAVHAFLFCLVYYIMVASIS